jgi:hypothetical protein
MENHLSPAADGNILSEQQTTADLAGGIDERDSLGRRNGMVVAVNGHARRLERFTDTDVICTACRFVPRQRCLELAEVTGRRPDRACVLSMFGVGQCRQGVGGGPVTVTP